MCGQPKADHPEGPRRDPAVGPAAAPLRPGQTRPSSELTARSLSPGHALRFVPRICSAHTWVFCAFEKMKIKDHIIQESKPEGPRQNKPWHSAGWGWRRGQRLAGLPAAGGQNLLEVLGAGSSRKRWPAPRPAPPQCRRLGARGEAEAGV